MVAALTSSPLLADAPAEPTDEERMLLYVSFDEYERLREALGERSSPRMTYLKGVLEIMTPSRHHEMWKKNIARFVEHYAFAQDIDLRGYGSTTFKKAAKDRGAEPDECYVVGEILGEVPDVALEVVYSRPRVNKLEVYAGLGVPEVWMFRNGAFTVFELAQGAYIERVASRFLPALDFALLARFVTREDVTKALRQFDAEAPRYETVRSVISSAAVVTGQRAGRAPAHVGGGDLRRIRIDLSFGERRARRA